MAWTSVAWTRVDMVGVGMDICGVGMVGAGMDISEVGMDEG